MLHAEEIAAASERLTVLVMGTNDLAKELHAEHVPGRQPLLTGLGLCLLAARAAGKVILDGVYNDIKDEDGFEAECLQGRQMGFDGKTLIHPSQLEPCQPTCSPRGRGRDRRRPRDHRRLRGGHRRRQGRRHRQRPHDREHARRQRPPHPRPRRRHRRPRLTLRPRTTADAGSRPHAISCRRESRMRDCATEICGAGAQRSAVARRRYWTLSTRRRAMTLRQRVSSAPSKIDSTRASTK